MKTRSFFFAISLTAMASHPLQAREWGVINTCTADVYTEASYTSPVDTQVHLGSLVEIIGKDGIWVKINTGQAIEGWITEKCMTFMTEEKTEEYRNTPKCICTVNCATVWGKAGDDRSRISPLVMGDSLVVIPSTAGQEWIKVALPDGREGWVNRSDFMETDKWRARNAAMTPEERIEEIIRLAVGMLGTPYVWGGLSTVGLDCSGLTRLCFSMAGMDIPRNSGPQFTTGIAVPFREDELTGWELDSLKRGDLVFFGKTGKKTEDTKVSHVGIFLGNGKFIQSSHFVRINSLYRSDADVYENAHKLVGVKRLIGR